MALITSVKIVIFVTAKKFQSMKKKLIKKMAESQARDDALQEENNYGKNRT